MHARFRIRKILVTPADGQPMLFMELDIDCDLCGQTQGTIHGHHLATLHAYLGEMIRDHPDLCGEVGEVKEVTSFAGVVDPGKVQLN